MDKIRCNLAQRLQHKASEMHARMREHKVGSVKHQRVVENHVNVHGPRRIYSAAILLNTGSGQSVQTATAQQCLNSQSLCKSLMRRQCRLHTQRPVVETLRTLVWCEHPPGRSLINVRNSNDRPDKFPYQVCRMGYHLLAVALIAANQQKCSPSCCR